MSSNKDTFSPLLCVLPGSEILRCCMLLQVQVPLSSAVGSSYIFSRSFICDDVSCSCFDGWGMYLIFRNAIKCPHFVNDLPFPRSGLYLIFDLPFFAAVNRCIQGGIKAGYCHASSCLCFKPGHWLAGEPQGLILAKTKIAFCFTMTSLSFNLFIFGIHCSVL